MMTLHLVKKIKGYGFDSHLAVDFRVMNLIHGAARLHCFDKDDMLLVGRALLSCMHKTQKMEECRCYSCECLKTVLMPVVETATLLV
jgi:hypothetical protein